MAIIYTPDVPQGAQQINNTQFPIQQDFEYIYNLFAINHVPFNTADDFGKHTFVSYIQQASDPSTASAEMALYSKQVINDPNGMELFARYPDNGQVVQLTGNSGSISGAGSGGYFTITTTATQLGNPLYGFYQYLPGNIIMYDFVFDNYVTSARSSPYTLTFPCGFTDIITGNTLPSFTQNPFYLGFSSLSGWGSSAFHYAGVVTSKTTASLYYNGAINVNSTVQSLKVTVIGV